MEALFYSLVGLVGISLFGFFYFENKSIVTSWYRLDFDFLPKEFNRFTIVHLSDLHNKWFGKNQEHLVFAIKKVEPDIVVITGDMIDESFLFKKEPALELFRQLKDIAPAYYVSGNHEWARPEYQSFRQDLIDLGVHVLDNRVATIERNGAMIAIAGIDDYACHPAGLNPKKAIHQELSNVRAMIDERAFKILLVHRPEWLREYMEHNFNLIFAGHAHGGQWNLPGIGPIFSPGQGLFPRMVSGAHKRHSTFMVVSRGLGNSGVLAFQRLFNKPEVVVTVLKKTM